MLSWKYRTIDSQILLSSHLTNKFLKTFYLDGPLSKLVLLCATMEMANGSLCGIETYNQLRCLTMEPEAVLQKLLISILDLSFDKKVTFLK